MSKTPFSLTGKRILITGASSGIGRATAIECTKAGATVILTGRDRNRLNETYDALSGTGHLVIAADLDLPTDISRLCAEISLIDGVVHSAGISRRELCKDMTANNLRDVMAINFEAPVLLQAALLSAKKINKEASIVFIASKAAEFPAVGNAIYSASKGAIVSYAKVLALELAARKIRVNCICPAMVWTNLITADNTLSKDELEQGQMKYPLKRYGIPEDVAYLAVYLLSGASSWMTGSCLDITGGSREL